ncbi:MAG: hypothetical protein QOF41_770 [Methylobacteriaceae bacterium]|nr:hypothetical protein [Methylobacteriaceae bacterium]
MHNDLAWSVLGVDPAIHKNLEHLASRQGVSIGRFLELMIHSVGVKESRELKRRKQLRGLMAEMAESIMEAADLLDEGDGAMRSPGKTQAAPPIPQPAIPANSDQMDDKKDEEKVPSKISDFRRSLLRRSA